MTTAARAGTLIGVIAVVLLAAVLAAAPTGFAIACAV